MGSSLDDETDMAALEASVRSIEKDGLLWGASKLVAVGFGIKKLQITLVIEDEKISLSDLEEEIQAFEDYVQSTDVVSLIDILVNSWVLTTTIGCHAEAINYKKQRKRQLAEATLTYCMRERH
jgi:translation elongation factor EF-1beta